MAPTIDQLWEVGDDAGGAGVVVCTANVHPNLGGCVEAVGNIEACMFAPADTSAVASCYDGGKPGQPSRRCCVVLLCWQVASSEQASCKMLHTYEAGGDGRALGEDYGRGQEE